MRTGMANLKPTASNFGKRFRSLGVMEKPLGRQLVGPVVGIRWGLPPEFTTLLYYYYSIVNSLSLTNKAFLNQTRAVILK